MDALYEHILPYVVFAMQTLTVAIVCGKRMFARRAGIENACACRIARDPPEPFFEDAMRRWSARFGPYGRAAEEITPPLPPAPSSIRLIALAHLDLIADSGDDALQAFRTR